jgi:hypothetical protein
MRARITMAAWLAVLASPVCALESDIGGTFVASIAPVAVAPPADATSLIQGLLNAGTAVVVPCDGNAWNVTGLTKPAGKVTSIRGECPGAILHVTANAPAIYCANDASPLVVRDLTITGTAPNYNGTINISDAGQAAVHWASCPNVILDKVNARNISGTAFDCEYATSNFNTAAAPLFASLSAWNSYRGFLTRNACEYATFANIQARNNIFGMQVLSGNVTVAGFELVWNYNNLQIVGQGNANPCHGTFSGGVSNHGVYNLDVLSCPLGQNFTGVSFIGDPSGSLSGTIRIANSRGINIVGGQMGSNITVLQNDPTPWNASAFAGANSVANTFVRDDIAGFTMPSVGYAGGLLSKGNINAAGAWPGNNW